MRATASKVALLDACAYWARDEVPWSDTGPREASDFGNIVHACLAAEINGKTLDIEALEKATDLSDNEIERLKTVVSQGVLWIAKNRRVGWVAERAFAYNPETDTAREINTPTARDYSAAREDELCGSADLAFVAQDRDGPVCIVPDFKSGFQQVEHPRGNLQLHTLALMACRAWNISRARILILHVTTEGVQEKYHDLSECDLDAIAIELRDLIRSVPTSEPQSGLHCSERWCPAAPSCPAIVEPMNEIVPVAQLVARHRLQVQIESQEHAAWSLAVIDAIDDAAHAIRNSLKAYADSHDGITLADGRVWSKRIEARETINLKAPGAVEELEGLGLESAIDSNPKTSWTEIKRVGGAKAEAAAREALRAIGATKTVEVIKYQATKKKGR